MPKKPQFKYFLSNTINPVKKNSEIWSAPLPATRKQSTGKDDNSVTYGDYFSAVCSFLKENRFNIICSAVSKKLNQHTVPEDIEEICIFLEKHGGFYHPARVEMSLNRLNLNFVLNVAISEQGKEYIYKEYKALKRLNRDFAFSFIPQAYGIGKTCAKGSRPEIIMFIGEWFDGYSEFHISCDNLEKLNKINIWDSEKGSRFLSLDNTMELYKQAAMVLTCYYNIETFEQIFPWHHAAGDFVIKCDNDNKLELKLITVRQYAPMFKNINKEEYKDNDSVFILEAMLVFFLNLCMRMRLDRLNGVGNVVWADDVAVKGTLKGFFNGLSKKPQISAFPEPVDVFFKKYLLSCTKSDLNDLSTALLNTYNPLAPELPVIKLNMDKHIKIIYDSIRQM